MFHNLISRVTPHHFCYILSLTEVNSATMLEELPEAVNAGVWGSLGHLGGSLLPFQTCIEHLLTSSQWTQNFPYVNTTQSPETIPKAGLLFILKGSTVLW